MHQAAPEAYGQRYLREIQGGADRNEYMKPETLKIVQKVHDLFAKKRLTLSLAESCTGGMISHLVTTLPGASTFFTAGIVSYSELAKKDILGVSDNVISENGVVSQLKIARAIDSIAISFAILLSPVIEYANLLISAKNA